MSGTRTFLLELHCEEIPARFLSGLHFAFIDAFYQKLSESSLTPDGVAMHQRGFTAKALPDFYSPRKLTWA
ncbi:MAG TPA: hypothetical protein VL181_10215, partial [Holophagaceae bacterium]|nr:hypothetical protein [Holophagaceae bacterium]